MSVQVDNMIFSTGHNLTSSLVNDGAPELPEGFSYRLHIVHGDGPGRVTARIGYTSGDEWVEVARFTEVTRANLHGATVAAAVHAHEVWQESR
jgi:hypothetical protein